MVLCGFERQLRCAWDVSYSMHIQTIVVVSNIYSRHTILLSSLTNTSAAAAVAIIIKLLYHYSTTHMCASLDC